ncbi:MAG: hypothetical protein HY651_03630 [Acidobacteria bacterium]|nr:hypothetical protein [Acidobacteriota bacterium]
MKRVVFFCFVMGTFSIIPMPSMAQQPTITANSIRNAASNAIPGLPNAGIAQGSVFVISGNNLGPANPVPVGSFPLPGAQGLAGTSVRVTVGGTTVNALMLYTQKTQVFAVLPSNTPIGTGTVQVIYNNQTSAASPLTVVARNLGIFTLNQSGSGPGVIQNINSETDAPLNGPTSPARPGQTIVLWGTGIGPVSGNEAAGALPGNMSGANLHIFVGTQEATIQYQGRSDCCVGIDQVAFTVPPGIEGCAVPVWATANGVASNFASTSIAASGSNCSDPGGYSDSQWNTARTNGSLRIGVLSVGRFFLRGIGAFPFEMRTDSIGAQYSRVPLETLLKSPGSPPIGNCFVQQFPGPTFPPNKFLNAGTISVNGPVGNRTLTQQNPGSHYVIFSPGSPATPGYVTDGTLVTAGTYNFTATAGSEVGAHSASINHPATFHWNEYSTFSTDVSRSQPFTFTWTGGSPGGIVTIIGQSQSAPGVGAQIYCYADAMAGSFAVPAAILSALPATYTDTFGIPQGSWGVVNAIVEGPISIPGIDQGSIIATDGFNVGPIKFQ